MTYHFVQLVIGFSYSFPVITVDNKYQTLRAKTTVPDVQTDEKYSKVNINCSKQKPKIRYQPELHVIVSYQHWYDHNVKLHAINDTGVTPATIGNRLVIDW